MFCGTKIEKQKYEVESGAGSVVEKVLCDKSQRLKWKMRGRSSRSSPHLHRSRLRSLCSSHNSLGGQLVAIIGALRRPILWKSSYKTKAPLTGRGRKKKSRRIVTRWDLFTNGTLTSVSGWSMPKKENDGCTRAYQYTGCANIRTSACNIVAAMICRCITFFFFFGGQFSFQFTSRIFCNGLIIV